jgi:hypothetical protein
MQQNPFENAYQNEVVFIADCSLVGFQSRFGWNE